MVLEMSIILRQHTPFQGYEEICPRCRYLNLNATATNGWIDCCQCAGQFHVGNDIVNGHGEGAGDNGDEELGVKDGGRGGGSGGEIEKDDDGVIELISPVSGSNMSKASGNKNRGDGHALNFSAVSM